MDLFERHESRITGRDIHMVQLISLAGQKMGKARFARRTTRHAHAHAGDFAPRTPAEYAELLQNDQRAMEQFEASRVQWRILRYFRNKFGRTMRLAPLQLDYWLNDKRIVHVAGAASRQVLAQGIRQAKYMILEEGIARPFARELEREDFHAFTQFADAGSAVAEDVSADGVYYVVEYVTYRLAQVMDIDREIDRWLKEGESC